MSSDQGPGNLRVRITPGTAFKAGFFAAFGVVVFSLALSLVATVVVLVLAAMDVLPGVAQLYRAATGSP